MRLTSLQVFTVVYEPFPDAEFVSEYNVELTNLENLLRRSDVVSLHLPVMPDTRGIINRHTLSIMKPGALLVNTARGALIVEKDLLEALHDGPLAAADLDVLEVEPPPSNHRLLGQDNVLFSPHAAGIDQPSHRGSVVMVAQVLVDLYQGRWPAECIVNLEGVSDWTWDDRSSP